MTWLASAKFEPPLDPELVPEPEPALVVAVGTAEVLTAAEGGAEVEIAVGVLLVELFASEVLVGSGVDVVLLVVGSGVEVVSGGGDDVVVLFLVEVVVGGSQVVVGSGSFVVSGCLVVLGGSTFLVEVVLGGSLLPSLKVHVIGKTPSSVLANCSNNDWERSSEP